MNIPAQIKSMRVSLNLSQRELANKMGVPHSTIVRIESGDLNVSQKTIEKFCKATNTTMYFVKTNNQNVVELIDRLVEENTVLSEKIKQIENIIKNNNK